MTGPVIVALAWCLGGSYPCFTTPLEACDYLANEIAKLDRSVCVVENRGSAQCKINHAFMEIKPDCATGAGYLGDLRGAPVCTRTYTLRGH